MKKVNPFRQEELRDRLAFKGRLEEFRNTYSDSNKYPSLKDKNTDVSWGRLIQTGRSDLIKSPIFQDKIRIVCRYLFKKRGRLLDIGFGHGIVEDKLIFSNSALKISGIDISTVAVINAKKKIRGIFKKGNIEKIPFGSSSFDFVLALDVLEHLPPRKTFRALFEIIRVLRSGGILVASVPLNENLEAMVLRNKNPSLHLRVYTRNIIKTELKLVNLKVFSEVYLYAFKNFYKIKSLFVNMFPFKIKKPNLIIVFASK